MIIKADCIEWMRQQPDASVDAILTSPPYNFDIEYNTYKDQVDDYRGFTRSWITEGVRILKPTGRFIINIQPLFNKYMPYHHWVYQIMEDNDMLWYGERIWQKNNINGYRGAAGSMGRSSKPYLWYSTEYVQIFCKEDLYRKCSAEESLLDVKEQMPWCKDHIWNISPGRNKDHPAVMPEQLAERLIKLFCKRDDIVYDPFSGSGTTIRVAKRLGCNPIGTEIDEEYVKLSKQDQGIKE